MENEKSGRMEQNVRQNVFEFYSYFSVLRFAGIEFRNYEMKTTTTKTTTQPTIVVSVWVW